MTNDVAELSGVVILTSVDVTLDTDGRDCFFNRGLGREKISFYLGSHMERFGGFYQ